MGIISFDADINTPTLSLEAGVTYIAISNVLRDISKDTTNTSVGKLNIFVIYGYLLQTVWTQIRTDRISVLI